MPEEVMTEPAEEMVVAKSLVVIAVDLAPAPAAAEPEPEPEAELPVAEAPEPADPPVRATTAEAVPLEMAARAVSGLSNS